MRDNHMDCYDHAIYNHVTPGGVGWRGLILRCSHNNVTPGGVVWGNRMIITDIDHKPHHPFNAVMGEMIITDIGS